jgi:outer membrane protein assembly factor BamA
MMRLIIIFVIALAFDSSAIEITGNRRFSDSQIARFITPASSDDSLSTRIKSLYRKSGYFGIEIERISRLPNGDREIVLREGKPARVAAITVEISPPDSLVSFDDLEAGLAGDLASEDNFNRFAESCIERMSEFGRPFASGQWREFAGNIDGDIQAHLRILAGPQCRVAGTIFEGAKRTRPRNLLKNLTYQPGQLYSESRVLESERLIGKMPYLDIAAPFAIKPFNDGDSCYIVFKIAEAPSTRFDGAGGYVSGDGNETFVGRLELEFGDILGTGRAFGFRWNRKDRWSSELSLNYVEPYLFDSDFGLRLEISQVDRDTSFIKSSGRIGLLRMFRSGLSGGLWLGIERTVPEPGSIIARSNSRVVTLEFDFDRTDQAINPTTGYGLSSDVSYKYRTNSVSDTSRVDLPRKLTTAGAGGRYFIRFARQLVFAFRAEAWGVVTSDGDVPRDEFAYLGGFDNLRGYAERRFPAYRYFLASVEPRLITGAGSRVYAFADLAQINNSQIRSSDYTFYPGYGLGVVAPSTLGQFKLEIGWGKTGFPDEGVLNFGLVGRF